MGAGGFRKFTSRANTTMPYNVGFLNDVSDTKTYNVAVYDELQKVSTASTHMFQALDDVKTEIVERTKALEAMKLTYDSELQRISTTFTTEINNVKTDLTTAMGSLNIDGIVDPNSPTGKLAGTLVGFRSDLSNIHGSITTITGDITTANSDILTIQGQITTQGNAIAQNTSLITTIDNNGGKHYQAQWGVKATVAGLTGGVGFINEGTNPVFTVEASKFVVTDPTVPEASRFFKPFYIEGGKVYMQSAVIKDGTITTAQIANARIENAQIGDLRSTNFVQNSTGWAMNKDGYLQINGSDGNGRMEVLAGQINIYDGAGSLRVRIGRLS